MKTTKQKFFRCIWLTAIPFLATAGPLLADVLIDDFNAARAYPPCCDEYGTYMSFDSNVTQDGVTGTLIIAGTASDNGGCYREGFQRALWDLSGQTGLRLVARLRPGNEAAALRVAFRDSLNRYLVFDFPLDGLNTNTMTTLTRNLAAPDWVDPGGFLHDSVVAVDFQGLFTQEDKPLRVELDELLITGPNVIKLRYEVADGNLLLRWTTNQTEGLMLQSTATLPGPWTNEATGTISGIEYLHVHQIGSGSRFFRLASAGAPSSGFAVPRLGYPSGWSSSVSLSPFGAYGQSVGYEPSTSAFLGPPSTNQGPTHFDSYIDLGSYSGDSTHIRFERNYDPTIDTVRTYTLSFSDHTNGTAVYHEMSWGSHVASTNDPFPWLRTGSNHFEGFTVSLWNPTNSLWPYGFRWTTNITDTSTNVSGPFLEGRPLVPFCNITNLGTTNIWGNTNSQGSPHWGIYTETWRNDSTVLDLHVGTPHTNWAWYRWVLLSVTASNVTSAGARIPAILDIHGSLAIPYTSPLYFSNITLLGEPVNADGRLFKDFIPRSNLTVNPVISGASNYFFNVRIEPHKIVPLTWAYHQGYHLPTNSNIPSVTNIQALFNAGSLLLAKDDDTRIPDGDPSVAPSDDPNSLYRRDDVPFYAEFRIRGGDSNKCIFNRQWLPVFPIDLNPLRYFDVISDADIDYLASYPGATIKQVNTLQGSSGTSGHGVTIPSAGAIIIDRYAGALTCVHEWGHLAGLFHRNQTDAFGENLNPGPLLDGIMSLPTTGIQRNEVNRFERDVMNGYAP
jgi:hypothetical protein